MSAVVALDWFERCVESSLTDVSSRLASSGERGDLCFFQPMTCLFSVVEDLGSVECRLLDLSSYFL